MMLTDPLGWFPSPLFNNLFFLIFIGVYAVDYLIPRYTNPNYRRQSLTSDRGSYVVIWLMIFLEIPLSIYLRLKNIGMLTGFFQWLGLFVMIIGCSLRQWALIHLGRFFSRTVQIETEHKVITSGPYQWIRHPAYTGMILVYAGLSMAIGTWVGTLIAFFMVTIGLLYRIRVEEATLINSLGDEYRQYMQKTWRLFPGW